MLALAQARADRLETSRAAKEYEASYLYSYTAIRLWPSLCTLQKCGLACRGHVAFDNFVMTQRLELLARAIASAITELPRLE